jgi:hypothetical protein
MIRERLATLERSYDQALAVRDLRPIAASLILPAEPESIPVFPRPFLVLGLGLLGGLGLGTSSALLLERRDQGLRTSSDLSPDTGTRCLAMVPEVKMPVLSRAAQRTRGHAAFEESIYAAGAGVGLFNKAHGCRTVLVTSSVSGEGKSTLCRALARALIASGMRVMLVEGNPLRQDSEDAVRASAPPTPAAPASPAAPRTALAVSGAYRFAASDPRGPARGGAQELRHHHPRRCAGHAGRRQPRARPPGRHRHPRRPLGPHPAPRRRGRPPPHERKFADGRWRRADAGEPAPSPPPPPVR